MTTFVDYAWWQVSPAQLRSMGFSGAMRYISHDGSKDLSAAERDNLRAAGFDIGLVYESTSNRAAQGSGAGHDDAVYANSVADALGYPKASTLWYAVDFDAAPAQVQAYFDGIGSAGLRPHAPYGSNKVIDAVRYPGIGWQTAAWSAGHVASRAGLLQNGFHSTYDSNVVLVADFGQWSAVAPTPQPTPLEDDLYEFIGSCPGAQTTSIVLPPSPVHDVALAFDHDPGDGNSGAKARVVTGEVEPNDSNASGKWSYSNDSLDIGAPSVALLILPASNDPYSLSVTPDHQVGWAAWAAP